MILLTYQPAFDAFHSVFRFLRLREAILGNLSLPRDHFRILDFYLLFPFRSAEIRLTPKHRRFKKIAREYLAVRPYGELPDDRIIFHRMGAIQGAALDTLVNKGLLSNEEYKRGMISATDAELSEPLRERIKSVNLQDKDLIEFLSVLATDYELLGRDGLKDRSDLMDFAYDAA